MPRYVKPRNVNEGVVAPRWVRNRVLARYCNVTEVTIWRWQRDPKLKFPRPAIINNFPYTDLAKVDRWMQRRVVSRVGGAV